MVDQKLSEHSEETLSLDKMWEDMALKMIDLGFDAPRIGDRLELWVPKVHYALTEMHRRLREYEDSE